MKTKLFIVIALLMAFSMANGVIAGQKAGQLTDNMVKTFVEYRLIKSGLLTNDNIKVTVANKVITLTGVVPTLDGKKRASSEAQKIEENYKVVNNLTIQMSSLSDAKIAEKVMKRIQSYMFYSVYDWVNVEVDNGVVTLTGWAYLPWTASQIQKVVEKVEGVRSVNNLIQKESGSDEIRYRAVRAIYSDLMFEPYSYQLNPPIHVIVNGANVELEGTVDSSVEKSWAENLVTFGTDAVNVTNNLVVTAN